MNNFADISTKQIRLYPLWEFSSVPLVHKLIYCAVQFLVNVRAVEIESEERILVWL